MSYIVSARKYRPKTFEDVVGQEQITTTLKRSIENDHLAQAFLFCGPRGVGKTTCARIMAKAVNTGQTEKLDEIDEDFSFNIFELDAASNNKVDDMHQLIAQVRIPPQTGKYKIYIIDEVHMLSQAAFNAFLKTLEEPPPYAIFILATTEKHKILPTILSRCQIYDFKRISVIDIVKHLQDIAQQEGITADESALHIVAEKADGALRDALSIFDRLVSFAGTNLTYEAAVSSLNVLDYDYFFKITEFLLTADLHNALLSLDEVLNNGFEGDHFINGLSNHFRNLMVCKDSRTLKLLELSEQLKQRYFTQAKQAPLNFLVNALSLSSDCDVNYSQSINKRLLVETTLMKMAYLPNLRAASELTSNEVSEKKKTSINSFEGSPIVTHPIIQAPTSVLEPKETPIKQKEDSLIEKQEKMEVEMPPVIEEKIIPINSVKKSGFSLNLDDLEKEVESEMKQPKKEEKEAEEAEEIITGDLDLNAENLKQVWPQVLKTLEEKDLKSLLEMIRDKEPVLNGNIIELTVDSLVEKTLITKDINFITSNLKSKFKDKSYDFELLVNQNEDSRKIILNQRDKYLKMVKENQVLLQLKESLDLELEL